MTSKSERPGQGFPERILVADVSHPAEPNVELTIVSEKGDWGDLPIASYVREDRNQYENLFNRANP